jgi:hypothetical protein
MSILRQPHSEKPKHEHKGRKLQWIQQGDGNTEILTGMKTDKKWTL